MFKLTYEVFFLIFFDFPQKKHKSSTIYSDQIESYEIFRE